MSVSRRRPNPTFLTYTHPHHAYYIHPADDTMAQFMPVNPRPFLQDLYVLHSVTRPSTPPRDAVSTLAIAETDGQTSRQVDRAQTKLTIHAITGSTRRSGSVSSGERPSTRADCKRTPSRPPTCVPPTLAGSRRRRGRECQMGGRGQVNTD